MADGSPVIVRGRSLLNPFLQFLHRLSLEIESEQFQGMKFLLQGKIPLGTLEKCESPRDLFSRMQQKCLLGEENLDLLEEMLSSVERTDLAKRINAFKDSRSKEEVVDSTGEQMRSELPAIGKVMVYFSISGEVSDFKEKAILDKMKSSMCAALGIKTSEISFVGREEDEAHSSYYVIFQIPEKEESLDALCKDAISRKDWLIELRVTAVQIKGKAVICLDDRPTTRSQTRQTDLTKTFNDTPHLQRGESFAAMQRVQDHNKLDLIVVVECTSANIQLLKKLKTQLIHMVDIMCKKDFNLRLALVSYKDHPRKLFRPKSQNTGQEKIAHTQGFTNEKDKMKSWIKMLDGRGRGSTKGLADGLATVLNLTVGYECESEPKSRPDAIKICLLLPVLYQEYPHIYHCEHGHDVMKLCGALAESAVTLYTVGVSPPSYIQLPGSNLFAEFFVGISLKTGGQYIETRNVMDIPEIAMHAIEEDVSMERLIGTTNDIVIEEVRKRYGDVNIDQLTEKIQDSLNQRSCRTSRLQLNGLTFGPVSDLAKKLSYDDNMSDACETFQRAMERCRQSATVTARGIPSNVETADAHTGSLQVSVLNDQKITSEVSERMVRKVAQRSAYYKPL